MKCPNCGFDSNEKFCRMCGTKIPEPQNFPNADNHNTYINNEFNAEQTAADNINSQQPPVPPVQNQYGSSSQGMNTPPQSAVPIPPQYYNQAAPQKSGKVLPIVLSCIIIAVIIAGTVINVYSSYAYNKSIIESIIDKTNYHDDDYYNYDNDYDYQADDIVHGINDAAKFSDGTVTLTKVTFNNKSSDSDKGKSECGLTFVIENTSGQDIEFSGPYLDVCSANDDSIYFDWLRDDIDYNDDYNLVVKAAEKNEFTVYYSIPNKVKSLSINFNIDSYTNSYNFITNFKADLK